MKPWNILVFPCGSEIGLEIHRSLRHIRQVRLIGASSVDDHGRYVFEEYIGNLPLVQEPHFMDALSAVIKKHQIDAVYPTMDIVLSALKKREADLGCKVITSSAETTEVCKLKTGMYAALAGVINCPGVYASTDSIPAYPVFIKPNQGASSRGAQRIESQMDLQAYLSRYPDQNYVLLEYLPGEEYTLDCFSDRHGKLRFCGARRRARVANGISVHTDDHLQDDPEFLDIASRINATIPFRGSWFAQLKRRANGDLVLLEVASRLGGSSATYRAKGVNFALLSVFDAFDVDVDIICNSYSVTLDRALTNRYTCDLFFQKVYVDFDDCLVVRNRVNDDLVKFLYQCINKQKRIILITKHQGDLRASLERHRLRGLFDDIIHIAMDDRKTDYIEPKESIFIDDAFSERKQVRDVLGIPVFSPDMIECLMDLSDGGQG
jgi:hypothetical protein